MPKITQSSSKAQPPRVSRPSWAARAKPGQFIAFPRSGEVRPFVLRVIEVGKTFVRGRPVVVDETTIEEQVVGHTTLYRKTAVTVTGVDIDEDYYGDLRVSWTKGERSWNLELTPYSNARCSMPLLFSHGYGVVTTPQAVTAGQEWTNIFSATDC